jgi:ABC-type multidrug transport system ATPase subunit
MAGAPVLAAGVGVRHGFTWALRTASFRMDVPLPGRTGFGVVTGRPRTAAAVASLMAGLTRPEYGELRVLGEDMGTMAGRAAVGGRIGLARAPAWARPGLRLRGLVERAARLAPWPGQDDALLAAAILDRLGLTPWARVQLRALPEVVRRQALLAAAAVHEPELIVVDQLLDELPAESLDALTSSLRRLGQDTAIAVTGCDRWAVTQACDDVITMADGIIVSAAEPAQAGIGDT